MWALKLGNAEKLISLVRLYISAYRNQQGDVHSPYHETLLNAIVLHFNTKSECYALGVESFYLEGKVGGYGKPLN